jgi:hypothetical protein
MSLEQAPIRADVAGQRTRTPIAVRCLPHSKTNPLRLLPRSHEQQHPRPRGDRLPVPAEPAEHQPSRVAELGRTSPVLVDVATHAVLAADDDAAVQATLRWVRSHPTNPLLSTRLKVGGGDRLVA